MGLLHTELSQQPSTICRADLGAGGVVESQGCSACFSIAPEKMYTSVMSLFYIETGPGFETITVVYILVPLHTSSHVSSKKYIYIFP